MRFSILILCCLHGTCWTSRYCVYQPKTLYVREGDSVTIPCSFTYPEYYRGRSQIIVNWGKQDGLNCNYIQNPITDSSGNIMDGYKDWISIVKPPDNNQTESLIIRELKASDGITFCCRVTMIRPSNTWNDKYGTSLHFAGEKRTSQLEELIAVPGEELIIPCHYPLKTLGKARKVSWYTGESELCSYNKNKIYEWPQQHKNEEYSLVNFPEDVSLRIHQVQKVEYVHFCCFVTISDKEIPSRFSTELITADSSSPPTETQTDEITAHEGQSVTLNCSDSRYMESDVLGVNIYWRVGNISGPYAYHPYKEMVHPRYSGRTEIKGAADLQIRGLQMADDSIYYCVLMPKVCKQDHTYRKVIQYGKRTRLIVTEPPNVLGDYQLVIIISITVAALLLILCVILVILKKRAIICKKKTVPKQIKTSDNAEEEELPLEERPYCEISTKNTKYTQSMEGRDDEMEEMMERKIDDQENILYTELNKAKLQPRNPSSQQKPEEQTVYAAVISPQSRI
ncbi:uncharacterized protein ACNLHF_015666 [Anomaloglossus baeobatrachus]|uniref:uncharacterized protein LOC142302123 n=1 Tax=Anomaloglossus baeobatrachus TaxID=238106 RepID=UPI003F4FC7E7